MEKGFNYPPLVFNVYKPPGISSYDVVRHFKRHLPRGYGKIGHFGTLDPFAEGVLLIGVAGATRINDYVHQYLPKTYRAVGILGVHTETGDMTVPVSMTDQSEYLSSKIASFSLEFIDQQIKQKFLGEYLQAPHKFSAAKFEGKPLHQWAREGVEVHKEEKQRTIYHLQATEFRFPYLTIDSTVSSGTYIRTLFKDCAEYLGTLGCLEKLIRVSIGELHVDQSLRQNDWPTGEDWNPLAFGLTMDQVLKLPAINLNETCSTRYRNGIPLALEHISCATPSIDQLFWVYDTQQILIGLGLWDGDRLISQFNLPQAGN